MPARLRGIRAGRRGGTTLLTGPDRSSIDSEIEVRSVIRVSLGARTQSRPRIDNQD